MRSAFSRIADLIMRYDISYAELQGGLVATIWGLWFINPWGDMFSSHVGFGVLGLVAPDHVWGGIFLAVGCAQIYGIVRSDFFVRRTAAFVAACMWVTVGGLLASSHPFFPRPLTAMTFGFGSAWGYLRIGITERGKNAAAARDA